MLHHAGNFLPGATKVPLAPLTKEDVEFAEYKEDVAGPNNTGGFIMFDDIDKFQPFVESEKCPLHDAIKIEAMVKELPRVLAEKSYELGVCFMIDVVKEFNPRPFDVVKWRAIKGKRVNDKRPLEYIRVGLKHPSETFIEYVGVYCHMFFSNRQRMPRTYLDMRVALENFAEHRNTQPRMDGATVGQLAWAYRTKQAYPRQQATAPFITPLEVKVPPTQNDEKPLFPSTSLDDKKPPPSRHRDHSHDRPPSRHRDHSEDRPPSRHRDHSEDRPAKRRRSRDREPTRHVKSPRKARSIERESKSSPRRSRHRWPEIPSPPRPLRRRSRSRDHDESGGARSLARSNPRPGQGPPYREGTDSSSDSLCTRQDTRSKSPERPVTRPQPPPAETDRTLHHTEPSAAVSSFVANRHRTPSNLASQPSHPINLPRDRMAAGPDKAPPVPVMVIETPPPPVAATSAHGVEVESSPRQDNPTNPAPHNPRTPDCRQAEVPPLPASTTPPPSNPPPRKAPPSDSQTHPSPTMQVAIAQTVESLDSLAEVKHEQRIPDAAAVVASLRPTPVRPSSVPMGWPQPSAASQRAHAPAAAPSPPSSVPMVPTVKLERAPPPNSPLPPTSPSPTVKLERMPSATTPLPPARPSAFGNATATRPAAVVPNVVVQPVPATTMMGTRVKQEPVRPSNERALPPPHIPQSAADLERRTSSSNVPAPLAPTTSGTGHGTHSRTAAAVAKSTQPVDMRASTRFQGHTNSVVPATVVEVRVKQEMMDTTNSTLQVQVVSNPPAAPPIADTTWAAQFTGPPANAHPSRRHCERHVIARQTIGLTPEVTVKPEPQHDTDQLAGPTNGPLKGANSRRVPPSMGHQSHQATSRVAGPHSVAATASTVVPTAEVFVKSEPGLATTASPSPAPRQSNGNERFLSDNLNAHGQSALQRTDPPVVTSVAEPLAVKNVAQHVDELREWLQHWQASQGGLFRQQQPSHETAQVAYRDLMSTLDAKVKALQQQGMELSQINQAAPAPAAEASTGAEDAKGIVAWGVGPGGTQWPVLWSGTELVYLFGTHEWRTVDVDALQEWNGPHHDALSTGPVKVALRQLFRDAMTEATDFASAIRPLAV